MSESEQTLPQTPAAPKAEGLQPDGGMGPHNTPSTELTDASTANTSTDDTRDSGTKITPDGGMGPH